MSADSRKTEPSPRGVFQAEVHDNRVLCDEHYLLRLDVGPEFPPTRAGQFVQIQCADPAEEIGPTARDWPEGQWLKLTQPETVGNETFLRRPFSLAGREVVDGRVILDIIHRVVGRGSAWLAKLNVGDRTTVLGPLGNAFTWPSDLETGILVGGGVGIPPMLYLAAALHADNRPALAFVGSLSRSLLPLSIDASVQPSKAGWPSLCAREFARWGVETTVATNDGTLGFDGLVTDALWRWVDQGRVDVKHAVVYTCGPEPMMRAVAEGCLQRMIPCQVAMERKMACGMGTCQSCVCKLQDESEQGWRYGLVCTEGTVFDAGQIVWENRCH